MATFLLLSALLNQDAPAKAGAGETMLKEILADTAARKNSRWRVERYEAGFTTGESLETKYEVFYRDSNAFRIQSSSNWGDAFELVVADKTVLIDNQSEGGEVTRRKRPATLVGVFAMMQFPSVGLFPYLLTGQISAVANSSAEITTRQVGGMTHQVSINRGPFGAMTIQARKSDQGWLVTSVATRSLGRGGGFGFQPDVVREEVSWSELGRVDGGIFLAAPLDGAPVVDRSSP